jgi:acylphosphatase
MLCRRCLVSGHVQGVFYRASTREHALTLGVTGYARNLRDGRVEVLACGSPEAVAALCRWLSAGPPGARVSDVHCETYAADAPPTFQIV